MKRGEELNNLFKTLKYKIYGNRTNDGTPEGCKQAMDDSIRIEQIADDFAIEFAEWAYINEYNIGYYFNSSNTKELLETYKKEKGL